MAAPQALLTGAQLRAARLMPEDTLMEHIRDACKAMHLDVFHVHDARRSWGPGFPDLTIVGRRVLWAECKREDGELTALQRRWARHLQAAGQQWVLWRPSDLLSGEIGRILWELTQATERNTA